MCIYLDRARLLFFGSLLLAPCAHPSGGRYHARGWKNVVSTTTKNRASLPSVRPSVHSFAPDLPLLRRRWLFSPDSINSALGCNSRGEETSNGSHWFGGGGDSAGVFRTRPRHLKTAEIVKNPRPCYRAFLSSDDEISASVLRPVVNSLNDVFGYAVDPTQTGMNAGQWRLNLSIGHRPSCLALV